MIVELQIKTCIADFLCIAIVHSDNNKNVYVENRIKSICNEFLIKQRNKNDESLYIFGTSTCMMKRVSKTMTKKQLEKNQIYPHRTSDSCELQRC